jgi:hypothetical protein
VVTTPSQVPCKGLLDLFFDEQPESISAAKSLCETCPLCAECLLGALDRAEAYGVWGGTDYEERVDIAIQLGFTPPSRKPSVAHGTNRGYDWHQREGVPIEYDENGIDICGCRTAYLADARKRVARYRARKRAEKK